MRAFAVARDLLRIDHFWRRVESLDYLVPAEVQFELFHALMRMGRRASRWVLRNRRSCLNPQQEVQTLRPKLVELQLLLPTLFHREEANDWQEEVQRRIELGVQEDVAMLVASANPTCPSHQKVARLITTFTTVAATANLSGVFESWREKNPGTATLTRTSGTRPMAKALRAAAERSAS